MTSYQVYVDVGLWRPEGFPHHRWRGRGDDIMGVDAEQTLQIIHTKFMRLTHIVPMAQVEDLPEANNVRWLVCHEHGCGCFDG